MTARDDQPELYRVQTTAGESVVVVDTASFFMAPEDSNMRWFKDDGVRFGWPKGPHLDLDTLARLHLLTDDDLRDVIRAAYMQGAAEVHDNYQPDRNPEWG